MNRRMSLKAIAASALTLFGVKPRVGQTYSAVWAATRLINGREIDAKFLETRLHNINQISIAFGIPPRLLRPEVNGARIRGR